MRRTSVRLFVLSLVLLGSFATGVPSASAAPVGYAGVGQGFGDMSRPWDDLAPTPGRDYHVEATYTGLFGDGAPSAGGLRCTFDVNENVTSPVGFRLGNNFVWLFKAHVCVNGKCGDGYATLLLEILWDTSPGAKNFTVLASTFSAGGL